MSKSKPKQALPPQATPPQEGPLALFENTKQLIALITGDANKAIAAVLQAEAKDRGLDLTKVQVDLEQAAWVPGPPVSAATG